MPPPSSSTPSVMPYADAESQTGAAAGLSKAGAPSGTRLIARVTRGVGALSLSAVVNIIGQMSLVPVALYAWGGTRYGEWVVLTGLVSFLKLTDLGLQTYVVNRLCASYARSEREEMRRILHSALRVQLPLLMGLLAVVGVALLIIPLDHWLRLRTIGGLELMAVALLVALEVLLSVPMGLIAGIYRATGRLPRAAMIGVLQQITVLGLSLALIAGQSRFVNLAGARVGVSLVAAAWIIFDLRRLYPWLRLWPTSGTWGEGMRMVWPGLFFLLLPLADYLSSQFTLMVVQKTLDSQEVSRLATHRTLVNIAQMVSTLVMNALWPELTALYARAQNGQMAQIHRSLAKFNLWLIGSVSLGLLPFISWIYPAWTAGRLTIDAWTLTFLIARMLLYGLWSAGMYILLASNRHHGVALTLLGSAVITGSLAVFLVPVLGISGTALAALLGDLCVTAWLVPLLATREFGDGYKGFLAESLSALFYGIAIPVGLGLAGWFLLPSLLLRYLLVLPLTAGLALTLIWRQLGSFERGISAHLHHKLVTGR